MSDDSKFGMDQETLLTVIAPGLVILVALWLSSQALRAWITGALSGLGPQAEAVMLAAIGLVAAALLGVVNTFIARWLHGHDWPWRLLKYTGCRQPEARAVADARFGGEILPYTALEGKGSAASEFARNLASDVRKIAGDEQSLTDNCEHLGWVCRTYDNMASDLVKLWVAARVGKSVSKDGWKRANYFRLMENIYWSMSLAAPVSAFLLAVIPLAAGVANVLIEWAAPPWIVLAAVLTAELLALLFAMWLCWRCQFQAIVNWVQWQSELCRLFYVAYRQGDKPDASEQGA